MKDIGVLNHGMGGLCRAARIIEKLEREAGRIPGGFDMMERAERLRIAHSEETKARLDAGFFTPDGFGDSHAAI